MSGKANSAITATVNFILPLVLIIEYISAVYLASGFWLNICAVLLIMVVYLQLLSKRGVQKADIFFVLFALFLIVASADVTKISILCVYVLFSAREYYNKRTLKYCLTVTALSLSVIVLCYLLFGFNKQNDTTIYRPISGTTVSRMCFGFNHPNQFTIYLLALTVLVYMSTNKFLVHTFITVLDIFFFNLTQSRTVLFVVLFIYIAMLLIKFFKLRNVHNRTIMPMVYIFFIAISLVLSLYFADTKLDMLLSGRLALNKKYLNSGFSLLGTDAFDNTYFDNSYVQMIVSKGLIYSVAYGVLILSVLYKSRLSYADTVIIIAILMEAFMEVIFLKYAFMIIIPLICKNRINHKYDTQKSSLLLVRSSSKI